jgi:NAD(P)-dependent dehydrogenase (short-subunit alcohol dehydrogenase family)
MPELRKTVLVTGGTSGIGRGIAHRFAREGFAVAIAGRDPAKGETTRAEIEALSAPCLFVQADLGVETEAAGVIAAVKDRFGRLDVLVNNAGVGGRRSGVEADDLPGERWDKLRGPNLDAPYFTAAYAMPLLAEAKGAIVNISSTATLDGNWGLYCVAKAGVEGLTRMLAAEGAPFGVRCNGVSPGWIETDPAMAKAVSGGTGAWELPPSLLNRMGTPDEIAAAVVFLASSEASFITGQTLIVDGGYAVLDYPSRPLLEKVGHRLFPGPRPLPDE